MGGPPIGEIIASNGGEDDVTQPEAGRRLRHAVGFARIWGVRAGGGDRAIAAPPRAAIAEEHEGGRAAGEAVAEVGTTRLLADRVQRVLAEEHPQRARFGRERAALPRPVR